MDTITYKPIGIIHSPFHEREGMPIQPRGAQGVRGTIELMPEYSEALVDLDGFSHIILLYHFHRSDRCNLTIKPFLDNSPHGVFSTRAPNRPNPIGISVVELERIHDNILHIMNVDILDETPLLDIKPYAPQFDYYENASSGWLAHAKDTVYDTVSDDRFK